MQEWRGAVVHCGSSRRRVCIPAPVQGVAIERLDVCHALIAKQEHEHRYARSANSPIACSLWAALFPAGLIDLASLNMICFFSLTACQSVCALATPWLHIDGEGALLFVLQKNLAVAVWGLLSVTMHSDVLLRPSHAGVDSLSQRLSSMRTFVQQQVASLTKKQVCPPEWR